MVSWDIIIAPFVENGIEFSPVWQHIRKQLRTTSYEEAELFSTFDPNPEMVEYYQNKKANLLAQLEVLSFPAAVYDLIELFRHFDYAEDLPRHSIPYYIAFNFFSYAALVLKPEDVRTNDIKCLRFEAPKEVKDRLNENLEKEMALGSTKSRPIELKWPSMVLREKDVGDIPVNDFNFVMKNTLARDDKDDFVKLIYTREAKYMGRDDDWHETVYRLLFSYDAVKCATAVLAGETTGAFDIRNFRNPPLHEAAEKGAARITRLLLNDGSFSAYDGLPLKLVLEKLKSHVSCLEGRDSAILILSHLCFPSRRDDLETVRLLAKSTDQLKHVFLNYLNGGQMVEVATLLLVSRDELLSSTGDDFDFKNIADIHSYLVTNAYFSGGDLNTEMARLLKILDRIGDKLDAYLRLDEKHIDKVLLEIPSLVEDAGFHVKSEDFDCTYKYLYRTKLPFGRPNDHRITVVPEEDLHDTVAWTVGPYYKRLAKKLTLYGERSRVQLGYATAPQFSMRKGANRLSYPNMRMMFPPQRRFGLDLTNRLVRSGKGRVGLSWVISNMPKILSGRVISSLL